MEMPSGLTRIAFGNGCTGRLERREEIMALFGFRVRSADRDSAADTARLQRVADTLSGLIAEIDGERSGLRARRERTAENAAFSMAALEDDGAEYLSKKVDGLTSSMSRYSERIAALQAQVDFIAGLLDDVAVFARERDIEIRGAADAHRAASGY
jgi:hypothetical protein